MARHTAKSHKIRKVEILVIQIKIDKNGKRTTVGKLNDGAAIKVSEPPKDKTYYDVDGELFIKTYARVLVRNKHPEPPKEVK